MSEIFLEVEEYSFLKETISSIASSSVFRTIFFLFFYSILVTIVYIAPEHSSRSVILVLLFMKLVIILYIVFYFLSNQSVSDYANLLDNIKNFVTSRNVAREEIKFFKPLKQQDYHFSDVSPKNHIFVDGEHQNIKKMPNYFFLLNKDPYTNNDFSRPYCNIIICNKLIEDSASVWYYFLSLFFGINIIYGLFMFLLLFNLYKFMELSSWEYKIIIYGIFLAGLTYIFAKTIWAFIKFLPLEICKRENLIRQFKEHTHENYDKGEDYLKHILVMDGHNKYVDMIKKIKNFDNVNIQLTEKLTNIMQIAAPLFYLAYVTISIKILFVSGIKS